jgi:hypothetical protein
MRRVLQAGLVSAVLLTLSQVIPVSLSAGVFCNHGLFGCKACNPCRSCRVNPCRCQAARPIPAQPHRVSPAGSKRHRPRDNSADGHRRRRRLAENLGPEAGLETDSQHDLPTTDGVPPSALSGVSASSTGDSPDDHPHGSASHRQRRFRLQHLRNGKHVDLSCSQPSGSSP